MTYNSQVGSYTYGTKPHAVTNAGSNSYGYDANGNMTSKNGVNIQYNYDNMPKSMNGTTFMYDYSGQRVKKNSTVYIGKLYECTSGTCIKYIFAGGNRVAMKTGSTINYYHTDHLGSSSVMTDSIGIMKEEIYYYPFGKTRSNTGTLNVKHKFTGQELDEETGLYNYGARYYDPEIGRFVSADSIVPDFSDPQSLNRYSYCRNNPVILTDPTGHIFGIDDLLVAVVVGAVIGGGTSAATGGNILEGVITGAISGALFYGAGEIISAAGGVAQAGGQIGAASIHAAAGGMSGAINSFITHSDDGGIGVMVGSISGGLGSFAGGALPKEFGYQLAGQTATGGVVGGLAAEMSGGNFGEGFAQGAGTAAIGFLCNHMLHDAYGRLIYHRHGNNPPNWGIKGEKGTVTREIPPSGSAEALQKSMETLGYLYLKALSVIGGGYVAVETSVMKGGIVYDSSNTVIDLIFGRNGDLPLVGTPFSIPGAIHPPEVW